MPEIVPRYLQTTTDQGVHILTITARQVEGEDIAQALCQEMLAVITGPEVNKVVLNLQNVQYISSVAIRPLLLVRKTLLERNGQLLICGLTRTVGDVLYTTRLVGSTGEFTAPFEMKPDVATAVATLAGKPASA